MDINNIINATSIKYFTPALAAIAVGILFAMLLFFLIIHIYLAFALMTLAKKLGYRNYWLAWIPVANLFLFPILAGKNWAWGFMIFVPIANLAFFIFWTWIIYERRGLPGELSLVPLAAIIPPLAGIAFISTLIIIGIAAWRNGEDYTKSRNRRNHR